MQFKKRFKQALPLHLMFLPVLIWIVIFIIMPFFNNIIISFQDYSIDLGFSSPFIGFQNYTTFFTGNNFIKLLFNTITINVLVLLITFPLAVFFAIMLFECEIPWIKSITQTVAFLPFFISVVVASGILIEFLKADTGLITAMLESFGVERANHLSNPALFRWIYVGLDVWQNLGYNSLIFYAALMFINKEIFEAARIDGANKINQIRHITIPNIMPTILIMFILKLGRILQLGHERVLLLQNTGNIEVSEIISTYVYNVALAPRVGLPNYGVAAVVGIFDAFVAVGLILVANIVIKRVSETKLI